MTGLIYLQTAGFGYVYEDAQHLANSAFPSWIWRPNRFLSGVVWWAFATPQALHLLAVLVHLVNGALVWNLAKRFNVSATVVLGLFLLHPMQLASVAYLEGLPDLLMTTAFLGTVLCALDGRIGLACLAAAVASVCKESGVVAFGLLLMVAWSWRIALAASAVCAAAVPLVRALWANTPISLWQWSGGQAWAIWNHLYTVINPFAFRLFIPPASPAVLVVSMLGLAVVAWLCIVTRGAVRFGLLWMLVSLSLRFVVPTYGAWLSTHQVYEPFIGLWLVIGALWKGAYDHSSRLPAYVVSR